MNIDRCNIFFSIADNSQNTVVTFIRRYWYDGWLWWERMEIAILI